MHKKATFWDDLYAPDELVEILIESIAGRARRFFFDNHRDVASGWDSYYIFAQILPGSASQTITYDRTLIY